MVTNTLTFEERQKIESLNKNGLSCHQIAREIGRSKNAIATEFRRNGGREHYSAKKGQQRTDDLRKKRSEQMKIDSRVLVNIQKAQLGKRIANIEMQIEILFDLFKELREFYDD